MDQDILAMKEKFLCIAPWEQVFVNNEGHFFHCCMSEFCSSPIAHNGKVLHVSTVSSFQEVLDATDSKKLREEMLEGKKPVVCQKCIKEESFGTTSYRQFLNYRLDAKFEAPITPQVKFVDIRPGNTCNLKCRMCYPASSKLWVEEWPLLFPETSGSPDLLAAQSLDWHKNNLVWERLGHSLSHIRDLHFAGGEPLVIPEITDFLRTCVVKSKAQDINLSFNTNLTILKDEVLELWKNFKSVKLMISIDGTERVNDYIRFPAKTKIIDENLKKLTLYADSINFQCSIIMTVQIYNIFDIPSFLKKIQSLSNPALKHDFKFNILDNPSCYSICALPKKVKDELIEDFQDLMVTYYEEGNSLVMNEIRSLINHLKSQDLSHELPETLRRTLILDKSRKQNYIHATPELEKVFQSLEKNAHE